MHTTYTLACKHIQICTDLYTECMCMYVSREYKYDVRIYICNVYTLGLYACTCTFYIYICISLCFCICTCICIFMCRVYMYTYMNPMSQCPAPAGPSPPNEGAIPAFAAAWLPGPRRAVVALGRQAATEPKSRGNCASSGLDMYQYVCMYECMYVCM